MDIKFPIFMKQCCFMGPLSVFLMILNHEFEQVNFVKKF